MDDDLPTGQNLWGNGNVERDICHIWGSEIAGGHHEIVAAAAEAVRSGQLTAREADALLPACVCSGPSFVILAVGQSMLGSAELGVLLFLAQVAAGYLSAARLGRLGGRL